MTERTEGKVYLIKMENERMCVPSYYNSQQIIFIYNSETEKAIGIAGKGEMVNFHKRYTDEEKRKLFVTGGAVEMLEEEIKNPKPSTIIKKISPDLFRSIETISENIQRTEKSLDLLKATLNQLVQLLEE